MDRKIEWYANVGSKEATHSNIVGYNPRSLEHHNYYVLHFIILNFQIHTEKFVKLWRSVKLISIRNL